MTAKKYYPRKELYLDAESLLILASMAELDARPKRTRPNESAVIRGLLFRERDTRPELAALVEQMQREQEQQEHISA